MPTRAARRQRSMTPATGPLAKLLGDTEPVRRALYPVVVAVVGLLVAYGYLESDRAPLWLALGAAALGLGIGGVEAARTVAWAPATVVEYGSGWEAHAAAEYERGVTEAAGYMAAAYVNDRGTEPPEAPEVVHLDDGSGEAGDPGRLVAQPETAPHPAPVPLPGTAPATALIPRVHPDDQQTTGRCREVIASRRCNLLAGHQGPHMT